MRRIMLGSLALASMNLALAGPVDKPIDTILKDYTTIQTALANDTTEGVDQAAEAIHRTAASISATDPEVKALVSEIKTASKDIQGKDLEAARTEFFKLSKPLLVYLNKFHANKDGYHRFYCPMAQKGWIQSEAGTKNPYYGSSMLTCGEKIG